MSGADQPPVVNNGGPTVTILLRTLFSFHLRETLESPAVEIAGGEVCVGSASFTGLYFLEMINLCQNIRADGS